MFEKGTLSSLSAAPLLPAWLGQEQVVVTVGFGEKATGSNFLPYIEQWKEHITEGGSWDYRHRGHSVVP